MHYWLKENRNLVVLSYAILAGCLLAGLLCWSSLPDQIPTHFNAAGQPDSYSSRAFAVFGLPLFLIVLQTFMLFITGKDPESQNQPAKMNRIVVLIMPLLGVVVTSIILSYGLGHPVAVITILTRALGVLFLLLGNYLPKVQKNYTMGIRVPWTLADENNWYATHRVGGWCFALAGLLVLIGSFLFPEEKLYLLMLAAVLLAALVPIVYSYLYFRQHGNASETH